MRSGTRSRHVVMAAAIALLLGLLIPPGAQAAVSEAPDRTWGTNGRVYAIVRVGNWVFVGGAFSAGVAPDGTTVSRRNLLALRADTLELDTGFRADPDGEVQALAASGDGSVVFVGGDFDSIGGASRKNLAAVDAGTGDAVPGWRADAGGKVYGLAASGGRLFAGGAFKSVTDNGGSVSRRGLAADAASDGTVIRTWSADTGGSSPRVRTVGLDPGGSTLYTGGDFESVAGRTRKRLAAVDASSGGVVLDFAPEPVPTVFGLTATSNSVYIALGGAGGEVQALDRSTGARRWLVHGNGNFQSVAVIGDLVYVAGHYGGENGFGGKERYRLAAVHTASGAVDDFAPRVNSALGVFEVQADGNNLLAGGDFTKISKRGQPRFARLAG